MPDSPECVDLLSDGTHVVELTCPRHDTPHTHGGGDTLASAITAHLAEGLDMPDAVAAGKQFIERGVIESYPLGEGVGPVSPFWRLGSLLPYPRARTPACAPPAGAPRIPSASGVRTHPSRLSATLVE